MENFEELLDVDVFERPSNINKLRFRDLKAEKLNHRFRGFRVVLDVPIRLGWLSIELHPWFCLVCGLIRLFYEYIHIYNYCFTNKFFFFKNPLGVAQWQSRRRIQRTQLPSAQSGKIFFLFKKVDSFAACQRLEKNPTNIRKRSRHENGVRVAENCVCLSRQSTKKSNFQ